MKLKALIRRLQALDEKEDNIEVVVDFDENGFYKLEKITVITDHSNAEKSTRMVNLVSSNEL